METACSPLTSIVKSADRVLDMLEVLGCATRPMALAEVTQELGIPKSSALALLRTLASRGYVERNGDDRYVLAHPFGQEEGDWLGGLPRQLAIVARPVVVELVERTAETVNLGAILNGGSLRMLMQVPSPQEIRYEPRSLECPAYCTAMGRVLLAFRPEAEAEALLRQAPLPRLTARTETDPAAIMALVRTARRQGFAEIDGEYAEGGSGIAAPVFDRRGRAIAALNLATITERWHRSRQPFIAAVTGAAAVITDRLGGRPPLAGMLEGS
jgi:DNA-binding IclR family transcriptional regulator